MITQGRLRELFNYRAEDGALIKRVARRGNTFGKECGTINGCGYKNARVDGVTWEVSVSVRGHRKGRVSGITDIEVAKMVAAEMREKYHGQFANHGAYTP